MLFGMDASTGHKGDDVYEVEKLVDRRIRWRRKEYKVRWNGWPPEWDTWEPEKNINDPELMAAYDRKHPYETAAASSSSAAQPQPRQAEEALRPRVQTQRCRRTGEKQQQQRAAVVAAAWDAGVVGAAVAAAAAILAAAAAPPRPTSRLPRRSRAPLRSRLIQRRSTVRSGRSSARRRWW